MPKNLLTELKNKKSYLNGPFIGVIGHNKGVGNNKSHHPYPY